MKKYLLILLSLFVLCGCSSDEKQTIRSIEEAKGRNIGVLSGSFHIQYLQDNHPEVNLVYFNNVSEGLMALKNNKIDGYATDDSMVNSFKREYKDADYFVVKGVATEAGFIFSDRAGEKLAEFNEFVRKKQETDYFKKEKEKWIENEYKGEEPLEYAKGSKKLNIIACSSAEPYAYIYNGQSVGYAIEVINDFAKEYDYELVLDTSNLDGLLSGVASNKYDAGVEPLTKTEERKKTLTFSDTILVSEMVVIVRGDGSTSNNGTNENFIETLKNKIYRTFVEEDRYQIILNGLLTTVLITTASLLIGTILGFGIFLLARKMNKTFKKAMDVIAYVTSGLPVVVLLMILFYIIFAQSKLDGKAISIIGFSIIICFTVYGLLKTGVGAIDIGQFEAGLALGYSENKTLFKFILPQALRIIMPSYRNEIISLIKSSSVVGYVTVEDITRASDIIRSRTYDAFFPIIVTAILYFVLSGIIVKIVDILQKRYLPSEKTKDDILKSIKYKK